MTPLTQSIPAILGGSRAVTLDAKEATRWPRVTVDDENAVLTVLRDGDLSLHPVTRRLEEDYRERFGARFALAHCNGTAALLAAFFAIGLEPGDEVLAPTATFWASGAGCEIQPQGHRGRLARSGRSLARPAVRNSWRRFCF